MATATLYEADYKDTLKVAEDVGGADLVVTSPPYCDARSYENDVAWTMEDYASVGDAIFAALKPGGWCLFNVDSPVREWRPGFGTERGLHPWKILVDWAERVGFRVPDRLAFVRHGVPGAYVGRFRNDWEPLFWFQKPGGEGYFNKHAIAAKSRFGEVPGGMVSNRRVDGTLAARKPSGWAVENNMTHRGTVWDYGAVGNQRSGAPDVEDTGHPARFPFRLVSDIICCFSSPEALVCDPFLGGGHPSSQRCTMTGISSGATSTPGMMERRGLMWLPKWPWSGTGRGSWRCSGWRIATFLRLWAPGAADRF